MLDNFIIYCLSIYFFFHLFGRSDIAAPLRCGLSKILPSWLLYIGRCSFCFSFWVGLIASIFVSWYAGLLVIPYFILAAPVFNLVLDLIVQSLLVKTLTSMTMTVSSSTGVGQTSYYFNNNDGGETPRPTPSLKQPSVDEMVNRFLCWKLPATFHPDGGVSFDKTGRDPNSHFWPVGTNLFTAVEAKQMVEHLLDNKSKNP